MSGLGPETRRTRRVLIRLGVPLLVALAVNARLSPLQIDPPI